MKTGVKAKTRIHALDSLRGFALFGILTVNISAFAFPMYVLDVPAPSFLDQAAKWLISFAGEVKFFVLFSFLFGYGLSVQLERASKGNVLLGARYRRRLIGIALFGVLHAVFLFYGDILVCYAILGAFLWQMRHWSPEGLVRFGGGMLVVAAIAFFMIGWGVGTGVSSAEELQLAESARHAYLGSWLDAVRQRLVDWAIVTPFLLLYNWPAAMAMFAIGLAAGKVQLMQRIDTYWPSVKKGLPLALSVGILGNALYASSDLLGQYVGPMYPWVPALATAQIVFTGPTLTFVFCTGILWAVRHDRLRLIRKGLRAAGRLSLTNYLGQSFICGLIFNGVGLGLYEQVSPAILLLVAIFIFLCQAVLSAWWRTYFRFGPLEWVLRAWTYRSFPD